MSRDTTRRWPSQVAAGVQTLSRGMAMSATLIIFVMLAGYLVDIVLRVTVGNPVPGVFEYTEVALVAIVFLGVPYAMQAGSHVAIDSLTSRLPSRSRRWVEALSLTAVLPFVVWLAVASAEVAVASVLALETKFGVVQAHIWPGRVVIPIGATLLAAELVIAIYRTLSSHRDERPDPSEGAPRV